MLRRRSGDQTSLGPSIRLICAWSRCLVSYVGSMPIRTDSTLGSNKVAGHHTPSVHLGATKMPFLISVFFQFLLWLITCFPFFLIRSAEPCMYLYVLVTIVHSHSNSCDGNWIHLIICRPTFSFVNNFSRRCNLSLTLKYFLRVLILLAPSFLT